MTKPTWNSEYAVATREFLESPAGINLMGQLVELRPSLRSATVEESALKGAVARGYETCMENIVTLTTHNPTEETKDPTTLYPDLDNEKDWKQS